MYAVTKASTLYVCNDQLLIQLPNSITSVMSWGNNLGRDFRTQEKFN
jgi:hypothetical protein